MTHSTVIPKWLMNPFARSQKAAVAMASWLARCCPVTGRQPTESFGDQQGVDGRPAQSTSRLM